MRRFRAALVAAFFLVLVTPAMLLPLAPARAQGALRDCGALTAGHLLMYAGSNCVLDAGGPTLAGGAPANNNQPGTLPTGMPLVNSGQSLALYSGYATGPFSEFKFGFDGNGNGLITLDSIGGGAAPTCNFLINGTLSACTNTLLSNSIARNAPAVPAGFWTNIPPANVWSIRDRLLVGGAQSATNLPNDLTWLGKFANGGYLYYDDYSQFESYSTIGGIGGAFACRSSDARGSFSQAACLPIATIGIANSSLGAEGAYHAAARYPSAGAVLGVEIEVANFGNAITVSPYNLGDAGTTAALWLGAGGELVTSAGGSSPNSLTTFIGITNQGQGAGLQSVSDVNAAGTGYAVNDTITLAGGVSSVAGVLRVTSVGANGIVTSAVISTAGTYTVNPSSPVAQLSSSGAGTGAKFDVTFGTGSTANRGIVFGAGSLTAQAEPMVLDIPRQYEIGWTYDGSDIPGFAIRSDVTDQAHGTRLVAIDNALQIQTLGSGASNIASFSTSGLTTLSNALLVGAGIGGDGIVEVSNYFGIYPASGTLHSAITQHFAGDHAVNFWNADTLAAPSFSWLQKTGASAATTLAALGPGLQLGAPPGGDKGLGTINAAGIYYANGIAGVTCAGAPGGSYAVTNGIVTHC